MTRPRFERHDRSADPVVECLADGTRRAALRRLRDRTAPVEVTELAALVAAALDDRPLVDVDRERYQSVHLELVHRHLPTLVDADLVAWDDEAGTVRTTDHSALSDRRVAGLLAVDAEDWDAVLRALRANRRRYALAALAGAEKQTLDRATLARRVLAKETDCAPADVPEEAVADARIDLHHVHLPALESAGLLTYDDGQATYEGHSDLDPAWLDFEPDALSGAAPSGHHDVWTIEGRDSIVTRGQRLFERADDELFLMVTTDGLLEGGCVRRLREAVDRGVDVYVGSQTQAVRDLVREEVPGATIWEPQLDWLNLPPRYGRLGRLVFADREAVMLATLGEEGADGVTRETAVTGEGPNNSLVVLLRQMLGTRLDHLDMQSADFRSQIPL